MRGAWIEIKADADAAIIQLGRSPCGERGLKSLCLYCSDLQECRSPCGERGLKSTPEVLPVTPAAESLPVRGAWIEMLADKLGGKYITSLPVRGAWIEIGNLRRTCLS